MTSNRYGKMERGEYKKIEKTRFQKIHKKHKSQATKHVHSLTSKVVRIGILEQ
jgi:hypothetical protein